MTLSFPSDHSLAFVFIMRPMFGSVQRVQEQLASSLSQSLRVAGWADSFTFDFMEVSVSAGCRKLSSFERNMKVFQNQISVVGTTAVPSVQFFSS